MPTSTKTPDPNSETWSSYDVHTIGQLRTALNRFFRHPVHAVQIREMEDERDGSQWWVVAYRVQPRHRGKKPQVITHNPSPTRQEAILVAISEATLIAEVWEA